MALLYVINIWLHWTYVESSFQDKVNLSFLYFIRSIANKTLLIKTARCPSNQCADYNCENS